MGKTTITYSSINITNNHRRYFFSFVIGKNLKKREKLVLSSIEYD